jgi:hypothetical protein
LHIIVFTVCSPKHVTHIHHPLLVYSSTLCFAFRISEAQLEAYRTTKKCERGRFAVGAVAQLKGERRRFFAFDRSTGQYVRLTDEDAITKTNS